MSRADAGVRVIRPKLHTISNCTGARIELPNGSAHSLPQKARCRILPIVEPPPFFSLSLFDSDSNSDSNSSCPSVRASEIRLHRTTESLKLGRAIKAKKSEKKSQVSCIQYLPWDRESLTASLAAASWIYSNEKKKKTHEELSRNGKGTQKPVPARLGRAQREIPPIYDIHNVHMYRKNVREA